MALIDNIPDQKTFNVDTFVLANFPTLSSEDIAMAKARYTKMLGRPNMRGPFTPFALAYRCLVACCNLAMGLTEDGLPNG